LITLHLQTSYPSYINQPHHLLSIHFTFYPLCLALLVLDVRDKSRKSGKGEENTSKYQQSLQFQSLIHD